MTKIENRQKMIGGPQVPRDPRKEVVTSVIFANDYVKRLNALDDAFNKMNSDNKINIAAVIIEDSRIKPSERLEYFVKAAKQLGGNPSEAIEVALTRMEFLSKTV